MKKFLFLTGVAALALTSCSQEDVLGVNDGKSPDNIVTFRAHMPKASRSQEFTTDNLQEFMVFGFKGFTDDDELAEGNLENFFNEEGTPVKFSLAEDGFFRSETTYYYPTNGTGLYFGCFAPESLLESPEDASQVGMQADKFGGLKMEKFTVDPDIENQIDIIVANAPGHKDVNEGAMDLTFFHALSKIYISEVANTGNPYRYEIKGVKFGNIHTAGIFEYRGKRTWNVSEKPNPCFDEDGFLCDYVGNGIYWKAGGEQGEQKEEITYIFDEPIVLDSENTRLPVMSGAADDTKGSFMMMPQKLSYKFIDEDDKESGTIEGQEFNPEMSYIAFLVRIVNTEKEWEGLDEEGNSVIEELVVYPYYDKAEDGTPVLKKDLENISKEIDGVTYAWAAFPVCTLWAPQKYVDYFVDFSKGAGYVAPGAGESLVCKPILSNEIKFTEVVGEWKEGSWTTVDHENEVGVDVGDFEDPNWDD